MKAYTDSPITELGDILCRKAPMRECTVLAYDGDKYCLIQIGNIMKEIKLGRLYSEPGRHRRITSIRRNLSLLKAVKSLEVSISEWLAIWRAYLMKKPRRQLEKLFRDCAEKGWDGYVAEPVNKGQGKALLEWISKLPSRLITDANLSCEACGRVVAEWRNQKGYIISDTESFRGVVGGKHVGTFLGQDMLDCFEEFYS